MGSKSPAGTDPMGLLGSSQWIFVLVQYLFSVWVSVRVGLPTVPRRERKAVGPNCYHIDLISYNSISANLQWWRGGLSFDASPAWRKKPPCSGMLQAKSINQSKLL